jgi:lysyl-tRNA synthetase class 2
MWSKGFIEVETPMLHPVAGGAAARPFITHHNTLDQEMYLRIAPELYLKRLLVGGFEKVFELNRSFRNEGIDTTHNPEFTMMECYQAYGNMETVLELAEEVISNAAQMFYKDLQVPYQGKTINLSRPWKRASMLQLVRDVTGCQELTYSSSREQVAELAKKLGVEFEEKDTAV